MRFGKRVGLSKLLIKERFAEKLRSHSKYINGLLSFFYAGFFRFKRDIEMMIGDKICVGVCFWYFGACWLLISPLALLVSKHTVKGNQEDFPVLFTQFSLSYHSDLFDSYRLSSSSRSSRQNRFKTMATCTRIVVRWSSGSFRSRVWSQSRYGLSTTAAKGDLGRYVFTNL